MNSIIFWGKLLLTISFGDEQRGSTYFRNVNGTVVFNQDEGLTTASTKRKLVGHCIKKKPDLSDDKATT